MTADPEFSIEARPGRVTHETASAERYAAAPSHTLRGMALKRMDNTSIVFEDLEAAVAFFTELGMELEGEGHVEGPWMEGVIGIEGAQVDMAMMKTPDGHGRLELIKFRTPEAIRVDPVPRPVNSLGFERVMFAVDDIDDTVARLRAHGGELVGTIEQYEDIYRVCFMRGPEGILLGLAEELH